jgi:hypothetical protein
VGDSGKNGLTAIAGWTAAGVKAMRFPSEIDFWADAGELKSRRTIPITATQRYIPTRVFGIDLIVLKD